MPQHTWEFLFPASYEVVQEFAVEMRKLTKQILAQGPVPGALCAWCGTEEPAPEWMQNAPLCV